MAFLDKSKANYAFKSLLGKAHTSNGRELSNEAIPSGITLSAARIFADSINSTPNHSSNSGIVSDLITLVLEAVAGSDTQTIGTYQAYRTKLSGTVPTSLVGKTNPITNAVYAPNDYVGSLIPQSFGDSFRPILYSDAAATVEIPPSSSADWFIDCFAGIVVQEGYDDGSSFILGANGRVKAYVYIGRSVKDALTTSSGGGSASSEWLDSVRGFSQDLIGGTNAFFNFYKETSLITNIDSSLLLNGLRWIHIGSTVSGLNIYNPTTNQFSTGSISNNDVVQYFVSSGTSGTIGYIKTTPTAGTFTSFDQNLTSVYRFTGSSWITEDFGNTASNGLTKVGQDIQLGGVLTHASTIDASVYDINVTSGNGNINLTQYGDVGAINVTGYGGVFIESQGTGGYGVNITTGLANDIIIDASQGSGKVELKTDTGDINITAADVTSTISLSSGNPNNNLSSSFSVSGGTLILNSHDDTEAFDTSLTLQDGGIMTISGPSTFQGVQYAIDYADNYTNRSLVDKEFVLNQISYASTAANFTASNGLTKTGNNVKLGGSITADTTIDDASNGYNLTLDVQGYLTLDGYNIRMGYNNPSQLISAVFANAGSLDFRSADSNTNFTLDQNTFDLTTGVASIGGIDTDGVGISGDQVSIGVYGSNFNIADSRGPGLATGIQYAADYSADYVDRSLVDKKFVIDQIGYASTAANVTASNGLSKSGGDVVLGGLLTQDTTIASTSNAFSILFDTVNAFDVADATSISLSAIGQMLLASDNLNADSSTFTATVSNDITLTSGGAASIISSGGIYLTENAGNGIYVDDTNGGGQYYIDRQGGGIYFNLGRQSGETSGGFSVQDGNKATNPANPGSGVSLNSYESTVSLYSNRAADSEYAIINVFSTDGIDLDASLFARLQFGASGNIFTDNRVTKTGLEYAADYSLDYTDRSLVDKAYVDAVAAGLDPKASVRAATTSFITLSGLQTIDGVVLTTGDRVLVKDQGTAGESNGIYIADSGAWTRSSDFDGTPAAEVSAGAYCFVEEGTTYQDTGWVLATNNPIVLGTTILTFVQFSAAGVITVSNGLTKTGSLVKLGGPLSENTTITGGSFDLFVGTSGSELTTFRSYANTFEILADNTNSTLLLDASGFDISVVASIDMTGPTINLNGDNVQIGTGTGLVEIDGNDVEIYAQGSQLLLNTVNANLSANNSITIDSPTVNIDASILHIVNALTQSTSGYDIVVRNSVSGNLEKISGSVLTGSVPTIADKYLIPSAGTNGNAVPTGLTITYTPSADGYVDVKVNGISIHLGTASGNGDGYFAAPGSGGTTPRALVDIQAGDEFFWNSTVAGYYLDNLDRIDFNYSV